MVEPKPALADIPIMLAPPRSLDCLPGLHIHDLASFKIPNSSQTGAGAFDLCLDSAESLGIREFASEQVLEAGGGQTVCWETEELSDLEGGGKRRLSCTGSPLAKGRLAQVEHPCGLACRESMESEKSIQIVREVLQRPLLTVLKKGL